MAESAKSNLFWLAEMAARLLLVTFLASLLALCSAHFFIRSGFSARALFWLMTIGLLAGYAWAIYFEFPFFAYWTKRRRLVASAGLALIPLFTCYACLVLVLAQMFQDFRRARFVSPADSGNEIWFYDGGFHDRDLFLCARTKGQKARQVAQLMESGEYGFSCAQWTKDGEAVVCSFTGRAIGDAPVMACGYDFITGRATLPPWLHYAGETNAANWRQFEPSVQKLIAAHGGLSAQRIDDVLVRENEKKLWFWQSLPDL